jgi:hypothetical protein
MIGTDVQNTTLPNKGPSRRELLKKIIVDRIKREGTVSGVR